MKKINKKMILIISILLVLISIVIITAIIIINQNKKKEQRYTDLIISVATDLHEYETIAEYHSSYISSIWYNAIFKQRNTYTDKYAFPEDEYGYGVNMWVSFQEAINNYLLDNKELLQNLKDKEKEIETKLNELQNMPTNEYQKHLDILTEMYSKFNNMVSLVNSPTGTYKEYGEKCNKYKEEFESEYKKLLVLIPDIEKTGNNILNEV